MTVLVSQATSTVRELVATLLAAQPSYAVLHTSEPSPTDPSATVVRTSGNPAVRIVWSQSGTVLTNAVPITFAGIHETSTISWIAVAAAPNGDSILFMAEFADPEPASHGSGVLTIPTGTLSLIVA